MRSLDRVGTFIKEMKKSCECMMNLPSLRSLSSITGRVMTRLAEDILSSESR